MASTSQDAATQLAGNAAAQPLIQELFQQKSNAQDAPSATQTAEDVRNAFEIGLAALNIFLQINVTGPVPSRQPLGEIESHFLQAWKSTSTTTASPDSAVTPMVMMRRDCVRLLEVDGVSPYSHIPSIELFCLARHIFTKTLSAPADDVVQLPGSNDQKHSISWTRLRVHVWHYKLIAQPSLGGSTFTKSSNWIELPSLASQITDSMDAVRGRVLSDDVWADEGTWNTQDKVQFLLEAANNYILLGRPDKARELVEEATKANNFLYALSGALGKRTKFQEKDISQLVVLALSQAEEAVTQADDDEEDAKPQALQLNDDTLLEDIHFAKGKDRNEKKSTELPEKLANLAPDEQPQLSALDQITLLTEATIKDTFSPADTLTAEEILPFATRVLADKSTNWQTYTQALLVRSRIEVHRSRTLERGVLQMQAVADQVLTDTTFAPEDAPEPAKKEEDESAAELPSIQVSAPGHHTGDEAAPATNAPTSFFPAAKASESAPADVRLKYIHALSTPPRWHLEAELAYAWAGAGSLVSALEIFKRLRLWAEVALCLASADALDDKDGRGSGGEEKAKGIMRWQLFNKTGADITASPSDPDDELVAVEDITSLKAADFMGPERSPAPANAPRLWCILGDLEDNASFYERAWEVSGQRYARAQRSLAEHYLREKNLEGAHAAYKKATFVNRLDPDMWSRLGDISLRLGRFEDAAEAFNRAIGSATGDLGGEDAKTWSNLGTALWSLYCEVIKDQQDKPAEPEAVAQDSAEGQAKPADDEDETVAATANTAEDGAMSKDPEVLLAQALRAYKMGATASHDNWRIWENVVTLACRMRPPAVVEIIAATRHILRIRKTEDAVNAPVLLALLQEEVLSKDKDAGTDVYEPPRGTTQRLIARVIEEDVVPLITRRALLWSLVAKLRGWTRDYAGAIDASEKAWRATVGSSGSGLLPGDSTAAGPDWTEDEAGWLEVVQRTDELVSVLESWGAEVSEIGPKWKGKARSAIRSVMGRGKTNWEGTEGWTLLEALMQGLKVDK